MNEQELAGRTNARLNSGLARQRADELTARLQKRMAELDEERRISPFRPWCLGPRWSCRRALSRSFAARRHCRRRLRPNESAEQFAVRSVMKRSGGWGSSRDVSAAKLGYDVESSIPGTGRLRFIEVKGRVAGSGTVTVTKNEILTALNKPEDFILAIVEIDGDSATPRYIRQPFEREPDFGVTSVNYDLREMLERAEEPS